MPLAVRSSGVEEDSAEASYAGLFTTVLNVRGDTALLDAVRECWKSAFNPEVTSYSNGQPPQLAVLIQPMVPATAAGVAFTADPVTGERGCVVIDAITGIGDRLVSVVTPDRWVRGRCTGFWARTRRLTARSFAVADLAQRVEAELGGGPKTSSGPSSTRRSSCYRPAITRCRSSPCRSRWKCRPATGPVRPRLPLLLSPATSSPRRLTAPAADGD